MTEVIHHRDIAIIDLARLVCDVAGFNGDLVTDTTRPDGTMRRFMNGEMLKTPASRPTITLRDPAAALHVALKALKS